MLEYTNWEGGVENIGCLSTGCSEYSGLAIRPKSGFTWTSFDKGSEFPYICVSQCPVHFKWYPGNIEDDAITPNIKRKTVDYEYTKAYDEFFRSWKMFDDCQGQ